MLRLTVVYQYSWIMGVFLIVVNQPWKIDQNVHGRWKFYTLSVRSVRSIVIFCTPTVSTLTHVCTSIHSFIPCSFWLKIDFKLVQQWLFVWAAQL